MTKEAVERARARLAELRSGTDQGGTSGALGRAREQLESFAQSAAELEASLPERVSSALHESLRAEVLPVARQLAEVRGLSAQTIRRLERLGGDLAADREARIEDLALLVDLVSTGWATVERRLERVEQTLGRVARLLAERATPAPVVRLGDRPRGERSS